MVADILESGRYFVYVLFSYNVMYNAMFSIAQYLEQLI